MVVEVGRARRASHCRARSSGYAARCSSASKGSSPSYGAGLQVVHVAGAAEATVGKVGVSASWAISIMTSLLYAFDGRFNHASRSP